MNNFMNNILGQLANSQQETKSKRTSDARQPDEVFEVPGTQDDPLTISIWRATHRTTGERTVFFDARRVKDGRKLKTIKADSLPQLVLGLFTLARGLSRDEEYVDPTTRARLGFLADHLEKVVTASANALESPNGAARKNSSVFDLAA